MKIKRKAVILMIFITAVMFSSGCDSKEQREINKANIKGAKANAVKYIKQKYGFEATVKNAVLQRRGKFLGSDPLTTVLLEMEYCGKVFNVHIDGSYINTDGMDNYQEDEIKAALKELAENTVSGVKEVWLDTNYFSTLSNEIYAYNMYNTYYDGDNLFEIISEYSATIVFKYVQTDVYKNNDWSFWDNLVRDYDNLLIKFISYRSQEDSEIKSEGATDEEYAVYVENYFSVYKSKSLPQSPEYIVEETKNYVLHETNGFYYYIADNENVNVKITEIKPYDISKWDSNWIEKVASTAYLVKADRDCKIYIFYPLSDIDFSFKDSDDYSYVKSAKSFKENGKIVYRSYNLEVVKGYSVLQNYLKGEDDFLYFMYAKGNK